METSKEVSTKRNSPYLYLEISTYLKNDLSTGILDVTNLFEVLPSERLLLATVQAGTVYDGLIKGANLVQGGQLVFLSGQGE